MANPLFIRWGAVPLFLLPPARAKKGRDPARNQQPRPRATSPQTHKQPPNVCANVASNITPCATESPNNRSNNPHHSTHIHVACQSCESITRQTQGRHSSNIRCPTQLVVRVLNWPAEYEPRRQTFGLTSKTTDGRTLTAK
jgi:hypothetical protein